MIKSKNVFLLFSGIILMMNSCKHEPDLSGIPEMSFARDIQPIITSNCSMAGCHGTDAASEFPLTTYAQVIDEGDVKPGNAADSDFYQVLIDENERDRMPQRPNPRLSEIQIKKIFIWIEQGAKNN